MCHVQKKHRTQNYRSGFLETVQGVNPYMSNKTSEKSGVFQKRGLKQAREEGFR